jgi:hypothetical protein
LRRDRSSFNTTASMPSESAELALRQHVRAGAPRILALLRRGGRRNRHLRDLARRDSPGPGYVRTAQRMRAFATTRERVTSRELVTIVGLDREGGWGQGGNYRPRVTYDYIVDRVAYTSNRTSYARGGLRRSVAEQQVAAFPTRWTSTKTPRHRIRPTWRSTPQRSGDTCSQEAASACCSRSSSCSPACSCFIRLSLPPEIERLEIEFDARGTGSGRESRRARPHRRRRLELAAVSPWSVGAVLQTLDHERRGSFLSPR